MNRIQITITSLLLFASPAYALRSRVAERMVVEDQSQTKQTSTPRTALRSGTIEGVVVDTMDGPRAIWFFVESGGVKYQLLLWSQDHDAKVVGDDVREIGTRVKVTYANLTRLAKSEGGGYEGKAMKVINLSRPAAPPQSPQRNAQTRPAISANNSALPPSPYEDNGACPFECCSYRRWTANARTIVRQDRSGSSPVAFTLRSGERVTGLTGVVITTQAGQARVLRTTDIDGFQVKAGETIYLLTYLGEGVQKVWYKGRIADVDVSDDRIFKQLKEPQAVWWVKVKNSKGQIGWTDQTKHFNGMDACG